MIASSMSFDLRPLPLMGAPPASFAADARYPDWPCVQAKVPEISVVAVWDGPPIEPTAVMAGRAGIKDLVARLAARRTPMEDAHSGSRSS